MNQENGGMVSVFKREVTVVLVGRLFRGGETGAWSEYSKTLQRACQGRAEVDWDLEFEIIINPWEGDGKE
jgi:hypothetical protein